MFTPTMVAALDAVCTQHGLARSIQADGSFKIVSGQADAVARQNLDIQGRFLGLAGADFGTVFVSNGRRFKLKGVKPSRPKYPIAAECMATGRDYKLPRSVVAQIVAQRGAAQTPTTPAPTRRTPAPSTNEYAGLGGF